MAGSVGVFGRHSDWCAEPISIPFASLRNLARSFPRESDMIAGAADSPALLDAARDAAAVGHRGLGASAHRPRIPAEVAKKATLNTVLSVRHGMSMPLVLFVTGENLDQVAICTESQCDNIKSPHLGDVEFVLQLEHRVTGLVPVGRSASDGSCKVLAISQFQAVLLTTKTVEEKERRGASRVMLEPVHCYDFEDKVISASALTRETVPMAVILTANGTLYRWNVADGIRASSSDPICDYKSLYPSDALAPLPCVQYSHHPEICHVAACNNLFIRDFRTPDPQVLFSMESNYIVNSIQLNSTSGLSDHYLFACMSGGKMLLVDKRFASRPLSQRGIASDGMNIYRTSMGENFRSVGSIGEKRLPGLIVGGSFSSLQSLLHSVSIYESCSASPYAPVKAFYNACTSLGAGGNVSWDIAGFPIVGRGLQQSREDCGLLGIDLLPLTEVAWQVTSPDLNATGEPHMNHYRDMDIDNENGVAANMSFDKGRMWRVPYNALLLHQTLPAGDVFAQRIYLGAPTAMRRLDESLSSAAAHVAPSSSTPRRQASASSLVSYPDLSQESSSSSQQTLTQVFTFSQDGFALPQQPNWSSPSARRLHGNSGSTGNRIVEEEDKYAASPVLQCLPCGVRAFSCCELRNVKVLRSELTRNMQMNANFDMNQLPLVSSQVGNAFVREELQKRFTPIKISVDSVGQRRTLPYNVDVSELKKLTQVINNLAAEIKRAVNEFGGFMSIYELGQYLIESPLGRRFLMSSAGRFYRGNHFYTKLRSDMDASVLMTSGALEVHTLPVDVHTDLVRSFRRAQRGPVFDGIYVVPGRNLSENSGQCVQDYVTLDNALEYKPMGENSEAVCLCLQHASAKNKNKPSGVRAGSQSSSSSSLKRKGKDGELFPCALTSCVYLHLVGYRNSRKSHSKRRRPIRPDADPTDFDNPTPKRGTSIPSADGTIIDDSTALMDSIGSMFVPKIVPWKSIPIAPPSQLDLGLSPEDFVGSDISAIDVSYLKSGWDAD